MTDLSILMPVYNEQATLESAIEQVLGAEVPFDSVELIVVDDGSRDGSGAILERGEWPGVRVIRHEENRGKGAAVRTALAEAEGRYSLIMDADLEYDAADFGRLLEPLVGGRAEVVFGTRAFEAHNAFSFWYVLGNKAVTFTCNAIYNCWLSDTMTCHKAMSTELFRSLPLREEGFAIEAEITARLLRKGVRIYEVPISYAARSREEGKKLTPIDGMRTLRTFIRCRFR